MTPLALRILEVLPQTQCTRCGYPDCAGYAEAIAAEDAGINQCPPGGSEGIARLAAVTQRLPTPLDPTFGTEGPRMMAVIDEDWCIGCTLCIKVCPTDAILGANKRMHTIIEAWCTGCEICIPACPVDCISLENATGERTGWQAWSAVDAGIARERYEARTSRLVQEQSANDARLEAKARTKLADLPAHTRNTDDEGELARKRSVIEAAMARAKAKRDGVKP